MKRLALALILFSGCGKLVSPTIDTTARDQAYAEVEVTRMAVEEANESSADIPQ